MDLEWKQDSWRSRSAMLTRPTRLQAPAKAVADRSSDLLASSGRRLGLRPRGDGYTPEPMRLISLLGLLVLPVPAQSLQLELRGGSYPGGVDMALRGGQGGSLGAILLSSNRGPTSL